MKNLRTIGALVVTTLLLSTTPSLAAPAILTVNRGLDQKVSFYEPAERN